MINVMVIEDRILTLNALKTQIPWEERGLKPVGFYTNCREAIANLQKMNPDVIISDIVMPGMDGLSFCEYVNGLNLNIKIIIISAYSKFEYAKRGIQLGVYDFLEKPVDYDVLCERIIQAGMQKKQDDEMQKLYTQRQDVGKQAAFSELIQGNRLEDYSKFDYFDKKIAQYLECGDFKGITRIAREMETYIEENHISKSYILFFVADFLSTQIRLLPGSDEPEKRDYLSELERILDVPDLMKYFLNVLLQICEEKRKSTNNETESTVERIEQFIQDNYKKSVGLSEIARTFNMSPNYISRIFREQTGNTLTNYINDLKILEAKRLLVQTDMKIQEISRDLGYSNQYYFSMGFKKSTGYSPKDYRKWNGSEEE